MKLNQLPIALLALLLLLGAGSVKADTPSPLANEVILIIRHAEKEPDGADLTAVGEQRANDYVHYFENFHVDSALRPPDYLYASADSKNARRCRETITPLSAALKLPIDTSFKNKDVDGLAEYIQDHPNGKTILICWHHEQIGNLLAAFGVNPLDLIPNNAWPEDRYNWLIELRYDNAGHLIPSEDKLITEHVLPSDTD